MKQLRIQDTWMKEYIPNELLDFCDKSPQASSFYICELSSLSDLRHSEEVIGAIIKRITPSFGIFASETSFNGKLPWGIREEMPIVCEWPSIRIQLQEIVGNNFVESKPLAPHYQIFKGELNADLEFKKFDPREIIPIAGSGALVITCSKSDVESRKKLSTFHNAHISICTNIERTIQFSYPDNYFVAAYCTKDHAGSFHSYASIFKDQKIIKSDLSFSTSKDLALKLMATLDK